MILEYIITIQIYSNKAANLAIGRKLNHASSQCVLPRARCLCEETNWAAGGGAAIDREAAYEGDAVDFSRSYQPPSDRRRSPLSLARELLFTIDSVPPHKHANHIYRASGQVLPTGRAACGRRSVVYPAGGGVLPIHSGRRSVVSTQRAVKCCIQSGR